MQASKPSTLQEAYKRSMHQMKLAAFIFASLLLFIQSANSISRIYKPVFSKPTACETRPEFVTENIRGQEIKDISTLPKSLVFVAREAEFFVEDLESEARLHSYQSFLSKKSTSKVLCGKVSAAEKQRFSVVAPTIIDLTGAKATGHSLWDFQMQASPEKISAWNRKSPTHAQSLDEVFPKNSQFTIYQISHDQFEIVITQKEGRNLKTLSVRYDAFANLDESLRKKMTR